MFKHILRILIIFTLILFLAGCVAAPVELTVIPTETAAPVTEPAPTERPLPAATESETETVSPTTEPAPTEVILPAPTEFPVTDAPTEPAPTERIAPSLPYLQRIDRCEQSIYNSPGYDSRLTGTVRKKGIYTIVEEAVDTEGILWGKLKSGAGWVDLTQIQSGDYVSPLIGANHADKNLLRFEKYHYYSNDQEYRIPIAFYAYGQLRDVTLFRFEFGPDGYFAGEAFFTLPEMTDQKPLVAELDFPGDMTTYGIRFIDESGVSHTYSIYISGRNGALILAAE